MIVSMGVKALTMLLFVLVTTVSVTSIQIGYCFGDSGSKLESLFQLCNTSGTNGTLLRQGDLQESRRLTLPPGESRSLAVVCTADEPIQISLNFPTLKLELAAIDSGPPTVSRANLEKEGEKGGYVSKAGSRYLYHQWTYLKKVVEWSGEVSCQSIQRPEKWARLFLKQTVQHPFFDSARALHFFFPQDESFDEETTTIPCFGSELNGTEIIVELAKRPLWHNLYLKNHTEECVRALCNGLNATTPFGLIYTLLRIPYSGLKCHDPTKKVIQELTSDCSEDGIIACNDVLLRTIPQTCGSNDDLANYYSALAHLIINAASVWRDKRGELVGSNEDYNEDIGFIVRNKSLDYSSDYVCSRILNVSNPLPISSSYIPLLKENRRNGNISVSELGIRCDLDSDLVTDRFDFQLWMASCSSINTCEMAFRRQLGLGSPVTSSKSYGKDLKTSQGSKIRSKLISSPFDYGVVGCTGVFLPNLTAPLNYVQTFDFVFKGLDNQMYLTSQKSPDGSAVKLLPESSRILHVGNVHTFTCRISSFVMYTTFKFIVHYHNGIKNEFEYMDLEMDNQKSEWTFSKIHSDLQANTADITLTLKLYEGAETVECSAPRMDSSKWESDSLRLELPGQPVGVIVGITLGVLAFFILLSSVIYFFVKNLRAKKAIRHLSPEAVALFLDGEKHAAGVSTEFSADQLNFPLELRIPQSEVTLYRGQLLGEGQFGKCLHGRWNGEQVAVKIPKSTADLEYFTAFLREVKIMGYVGCHGNIVRLLGAVVENIEKGTCLAVLELSPYGDLLKFLRKFSFDGTSSLELKRQSINVSSLPTRQQLNSENLNTFAYQIANGMEYLSAKKVIHGDLAARNVLVFPDLVLKISDFGLAKKLYSCANYSKKSNKAFPWRWMAVESLKHFTFSTLSDVWSYGMTLWEIFTLGQVPFGGTAYSDAFIDLLEQGLRPSKPPLAPNSTFEFIKCCWELDPEGRPHFADCKKFFFSFMDKADEYVTA